MLYVEKELGSRWKWVLFWSFIILLLPQLPFREINSKEAQFGSIAQQFYQSGNFFTAIMQGAEVDISLLPAWLIHLFSYGFPDEVAIRLPTILALAATTTLVAAFTRKHAGRQSAIVAGVCFMSSIIAVRHGARGDSNMITVFFIVCAWLVFYEFSREKNDWSKAWLYSLLLITAGVLSGGYKCFFYFYVPLIFLRRPTDVRKRMLQKHHLTAIGVLAAIFFLYWLSIKFLMKDQRTILETLNLNNLITTDFIPKDKSLLKHYVLYPFQCIYWFLPWTFFVWPSFCAAFVPMEKKPYLFQYLRTIAVSLFLCFWVLPWGTVEDLIPLLGPLAIMTGMHYQILVRRHHMVLRRVADIILSVVIIVSPALAAFFISDLINFADFTQSATSALVNSVLCVTCLPVAIFAMYKGRLTYPVWTRLLSAVVLFHWCYNAYNVAKEHNKISRKKNAEILAVNIPHEATVYNHTLTYNQVEMLYLKRSVTKVILKKETVHQVKEGENYSTLAYRYYGNKEEFQRLIKANSDLESGFSFRVPTGTKIKIPLPETIYVIAGDKRPIDITENAADYDWEPISKPVISRDGETMQSWKGTKRKVPGNTPN